jgi:SAM-dependent methyltransferase
MALASPWLRQQRMSRVRPFLAPPVLDVGCGECAALPYAGAGYVGIDLDPGPLASMPGTRRAQAIAARLPFKDASFNTVLAMAVLEHVPEPAACLQEALRVLRPGGRLVLTTPTPLGDRVHHALAQVNVTSKHAAEEHQSVLSPQQLRAAIVDAGFAIEHFRLFLLGGNQVCVASKPARRAAA